MTQYRLKLNVRLDLSRLLNVDRYQKSNQPKLLDIAADRYLRYLRNRYISLSAGGGEWPDLTDSTIKSKAWRGIADNPSAILREYDLLLNSMGKVIRGKEIYVGYTSNRQHPRGISIFQLVRIHSKGEGRVPKRRVIGLPNQQTLKNMVNDVRSRYNRIIRQR